MSWLDISTTKSRERSTCAKHGCTKGLNPDNRSGYCGAHVPKTGKPNPVVGDAASRARAFVRAWLQASVPEHVRRAIPAAAKDALAARVAELLEGQGLRHRVPSTGTKIRSELDAGLIKIGTPRQLSPTLATEPDMRCPECPAYSLCLDHVLRQGWQAWTCRGCEGPGVDEDFRSRARGPKSPRQGKYG